MKYHYYILLNTGMTGCFRSNNRTCSSWTFKHYKCDVLCDGNCPFIMHHKKCEVVVHQWHGQREKSYFCETVGEYDCQMHHVPQRHNVTLLLTAVQSLPCLLFYIQDPIPHKTLPPKCFQISLFIKIQGIFIEKKKLSLLVCRNLTD